MKNDTVEGADLALEIAPILILKKINKKKFPLMTCICENKKLNYW